MTHASCSETKIKLTVDLSEVGYFCTCVKKMAMLWYHRCMIHQVVISNVLMNRDKKKTWCEHVSWFLIPHSNRILPLYIMPAIFGWIHTFAFLLDVFSIQKNVNTLKCISPHTLRHASMHFMMHLNALWCLLTFNI